MQRGLYIRLFRKRRPIMKLLPTIIYITAVFIAIDFTASQAEAGGHLPGCSDLGGVELWEIEVNALRAGGKTVLTSPNDTTKVTAKARIRKGTAESSTTLVTTLTIEAFDGAVSIGEGSVDNITLGVGKGGKGASINVATEQCDSGFIEFRATFRGLDAEGDLCVRARSLVKTCR
jgi:hypothetical protein